MLRILSLVYGGCCTNAWTLEQLLNKSTAVGHPVTFIQMTFVALQGLPSFLLLSSSFPYVTLRERTVPISQWALQVFVMWSMTFLNNWAFEYDVPLTLTIVFRSGGLAVSMLFGYLFLDRRYNMTQVTAIIFVTSGVIITTLSRSTLQNKDSQSHGDLQAYAIGVTLLTISLFLTGYLGLLQEKTYKRYGNCWKEGLFYMHFLALPLFIPLLPSILTGLASIGLGPSRMSHSPTKNIDLDFSVLINLVLNLISQLACVAGVNMLTTLSLILSVWWFGSNWNTGMTLGSVLVGLGVVGYAWAGTKSSGPYPAAGVAGQQKQKEVKEE